MEFFDFVFFILNNQMFTYLYHNNQRIVTFCTHTVGLYSGVRILVNAVSVLYVYFGKQLGV